MTERKKRRVMGTKSSSQATAWLLENNERVKKMTLREVCAAITRERDLEVSERGIKTICQSLGIKLVAEKAQSGIQPIAILFHRLDLVIMQIGEMEALGVELRPDFKELYEQILHDNITLKPTEKKEN